MTTSGQTRHVRETSIGWYIQRLAGHLDREMTARLREHGLTLQQFPILMTALETDGLTQADLAERFTMPAYAISRAIDALVSAGLIERRADPCSRRAHNIHATEKGRALAPALFGIVAEVNGAMVRSLSADERERLLAVLAAILADTRGL